MSKTQGKNAFGMKMEIEEWLVGANYKIEFLELASSYQTLAQKVGRSEQIETVALYEKLHDYFHLIQTNDDEVPGQVPQELIEQHIQKVDDEQRYFCIEGNLISTKPKWNLCIPLYQNDKCFGLIIHTFLNAGAAKSFMNKNLSLDHFESLFAQGYERDRANSIGIKRDLLLQVTKKCHGSMDIREVLKQIVTALNQIFPNGTVHLYLTHEWKVDQDLSIKPLMYGIENSNRFAEHAYLKGELQVERAGRNINIFAPLRGKQAVYGVVELEVQMDKPLLKYEIEFINMLADTGGNALENAELYQQSRNLNHDLQLINQTTHQLNTHLRLKDTISFMTKQIVVSFGAEQVGFVLFESGGDIKVMKGSTPAFESTSLLTGLDQLFIEMKHNREPQFIGDSQNHQLFNHPKYRTLLAVPMIQSGVLKGAVIVLHSKAYRFSYDSFKLLQSLVRHSTLAFTNAMLHERLEKLVITDHLTNLYSRNYLDQIIYESLENDGYGAYLLFDIDNFKQVNDNYGHQTGDEIIVQVANILKGSIRDEDVAARWGGEELAVYLPKVELLAAEKIADRIVLAVAEETNPYVTISCGVAYWHKEDCPMSSKELLKMADDGLYAAKKLGKNRSYAQQELHAYKEKA
ncbi:diguanylate cyclase [Alkalihalophilus lindianensis]|uniref:Diguanylate cyclase n=1 Tax=Alkalihalophilus lindianensis TaxID=1630542 RepID=A0ABU3XA33_9BACI|nr:diguanylate cyclase [Alkalihalophilus lindianensis]MDV2684747.1 diguanylate cyclase [Alkalihalophilus lindianensis]